MPIVLAFGFPSPFDLVGGLATHLLGAGGDVLGNMFEDAVRWLVDAVLGALVDLSAAILGFFWDAAEPDVADTWFSGGEDTPYGQMVVLAAPLLLAFFLAGIIQGVLRGDTAGMLRMAMVRLPGAVLAMALVVAITDLLVDVTDEMSETVLTGFRDDVEETTRMLGSVVSTAGLSGPAYMMLLLFGFLGLLAAIVVVLELFVRAGLIYIVVALSPLVYAAAVWESLRGGVRKLGEIGLALILSKFVIAVALALSAAALNAAWDGGEATEIATPEQAAVSADGGAVAETVGVLVGAIVMFGIAAFMPFVVFRLLPIADAAMVAQGIKGAPLRAAQHGASTAAMALHNPATAALAGAGAARRAAARTAGKMATGSVDGDESEAGGGSLGGSRGAGSRVASGAAGSVGSKPSSRTGGASSGGGDRGSASKGKSSERRPTSTATPTGARERTAAASERSPRRTESVGSSASDDVYRTGDATGSVDGSPVGNDGDTSARPPTSSRRDPSRAKARKRTRPPGRPTGRDARGGGRG